MTSTPRIAACIILPFILTGCGFAGSGYGPGNVPDLLLGFWHGLLAPWSLLARLFIDVKMYVCHGSCWTYDFGFLFGIVFSFPIGWIAAIIAVAVHIFA